jgi:O-antigen ligase
MRDKSATQLNSRIIFWGLVSITLLIYTNSVTDPVNAPKLFLIGGVSFAVLGASLDRSTFRSILENRYEVLLLAIFAVLSVFVLIVSNSPFTQSLYGVYGRNNGFLLYLSLVLLFTASMTFNKKMHFHAILKALFIAGSVNLFYGIWVAVFGDFIGWDNPYGNLLGTLGNPNFTGSFLGMFAGLLFAFLFDQNASKNLRLLSFPVIAATLFCIFETNAVQGKVLFLVSFTVVTFFWLRDRINNLIYLSLYAALFSLLSILALLGALQIGPLTSLIYKQSVSLRGEYWAAGWNTGIHNPLFGVGFDSYGDWYRRSRRESALSIPGVDTVTNTAHNVYLDILSFGGFPLFIAYVSLNLIVAFRIVRFMYRNSSYDLIFVSLSVVWIGYQLQSIISINQIGLAIWGWVLGGSIVAYTRNIEKSSQSTHSKESKGTKISGKHEVISPAMRAGVMSVLGFILFVPPVSGDIKWRQAQDSRSAEKLEQQFNNNYLNPVNSFAMNNMVGVFETSNLTNLAYKYAQMAVKFNPDNYDSWKNLYLVAESSPQEKQLAMENMKRLDPLNPNLGK